jgi:hypothetical protein
MSHLDFGATTFPPVDPRQLPPTTSRSLNCYRRNAALGHNVPRYLVRRAEFHPEPQFSRPADIIGRFIHV